MELVPQAFRRHPSCKMVEKRFGFPADSQILDDNFHHQIIANLANAHKRGRPDIVHFALLDITSTPAYLENLVQVIVHTMGNKTIRIKGSVRLPRTYQRFCGVMSKVLSGKLDAAERQLFEIREHERITELLHSLGASKVVSLSTEGESVNLIDFVKDSGKDTAWIIGGFPRGHFSDEVKSHSDRVISISRYSLPGHVVSARLCYAIELSSSSTVRT